MWHRQAAALALAADRVGVGTAELPAIQGRILAQRVSLEAAGAAGDLAPTPTEVAAAMPALGDLSPAAVRAALTSVTTTLDAADAALEASPAPVRTVPAPPPPPSLPAPPPPPPTPAARPGPPFPAPAQSSGPVRKSSPRLRNAIIYAGYSFTVLVVQVLLFATVDAERSLPLLGPLCLGILPAFAWAAGWLTIGVAFKANPGEPKLDRTPRLGVFIALLPNLILFGWLILLFVIQQFVQD